MDVLGLCDDPFDALDEAADSIVRGCSHDVRRGLSAVGLKAEVIEHRMLDDESAEDDRAGLDEVLNRVGV